MKIQFVRQRQRGMAVIVMLAILSIMLVGVAAGVRALNRLDVEIKLVEKKQIRRLATVSAMNSPTNQPPTNLVRP